MKNIVNCQKRAAKGYKRKVTPQETEGVACVQPFQDIASSIVNTDNESDIVRYQSYDILVSGFFLSIISIRKERGHQTPVEEMLLRLPGQLD